MSKELITKAEEIRDEVRVGANTSRRVGGFLEEMAREVNGLYENVLDWINNEKPQGGGFILTQSDVVNNLADESELKPLSAKQGKLLKAIIDALVIDNLVTNDETKALSAKQGKNLADDIRGLSEVYQPLGDYALEVHGHQASDIQEETNKRFMTDTEKTTLSSLGTNAILLEAQNLGQNGYTKFSNGLLIQWGYNSSGSQNERTIYPPTSFYDTNYSVLLSSYSGSKTYSNSIVSPLLTYKSTSYFKACNRYYDGAYGYGTWDFHWFAIGRWK